MDHTRIPNRAEAARQAAGAAAAGAAGAATGAANGPASGSAARAAAASTPLGDDNGAALRRPILPVVRWGAVLAGVVIGISVQLALTLLGIATGLSTLEVAQGGAESTGPLLWAGATLLVSAFVAGYIAARMSGLKRKSDGVLHGAVSWAVSTILFAVLATSIGGSLVSGVFNNMSQLARTEARSADSVLAALLRSQGGEADAASVRRLERYLAAGQRERAVQLLERLGIAPERAPQLADQALLLAGAAEAASPQARASADRALRQAGRAAWAMFGAVALALVIGIAGGTLGVRGARRVPWNGREGSAA